MKSSTCALDPFPTALVKANIGIIGPLITNVINLSLQAGHFPPALNSIKAKTNRLKNSFYPRAESH